MKTFFLLVTVILQVPVPIQSGTLRVLVRSEAGPVSQVEVQVDGQIVLTNERGEATLETVAAGAREVLFRRVGFSDRTQRIAVSAGQVTQIEVGPGRGNHCHRNACQHANRRRAYPR